MDTPEINVPETSVPELIDLKPIRNIYSRFGWSLCVIFVVATILQATIGAVIQTFWPDGCWLTESSYGIWLVTFVPMYLVAIPVGLLVIKNLPTAAPDSHKMGTKNFWIFMAVAFFLTYAGSFVGSMLSSMLSGGNAENALDAYAMDSNPIKVLFLAVLAPLIEEYVFRKQLIDRTRIYGEKAAVFFSALTFGLFHTNLFQFFYAFLVGWIFAFVYIRTGKLRYCVLMHSIVNFMGSVIAPMILSMLDLEALSNIDPNATEEELMVLYGSMLPGLMLYLLLLLFIVVVSIIGLILLVTKWKKLRWCKAPEELPAKMLNKATYLNAGMIVFLILFGAMTVLSVVLQ